MPSDVFWAAVIAGGAGVAGNLPTYLIARSGHRVQTASIEAENQRLREQHLEQRRRDGALFQRDTLIELQDWAAKLARATGKTQHLDEIQYQQSGRWGRDKLGEEVNLQQHEAIVNVNRLRVRILDAEVRNAAEQFVSLCAAASIGAMRDEDDATASERAREALRAATSLTSHLNDQIGERLRKLIELYEESSCTIMRGTG